MKEQLKEGPWLAMGMGAERTRGQTERTGRVSVRLRCGLGGGAGDDGDLCTNANATERGE
jgi:hypothetical protein